MTTGKQEISLPAFSEPVYERRVLCGLSLDGHNVIRPWGVEFADSSAFYSLEDGFGYRYQLLEEKETTGPLTRSLRQVLRLREGLVCLELTEGLVSPREFRRDCTLTCLEDTTLMDFVVRFRFLAADFPHGYIAGRVLPFVNRNVYHQYPVDEAAVGNDTCSIRVQVVGKTIPVGLAGHVYLRDSGEAWVLHVRMLPATWSKEVIKLCSRWFGTRPLPQWASGPLLRIPAGPRAGRWSAPRGWGRACPRGMASIA